MEGTKQIINNRKQITFALMLNRSEQNLQFFTFESVYLRIWRRL